MADLMPNYPLEIKKLEADIEQFKVNILKTEVSVMEIEDMKQKHRDNIKALKVGIAEKEKALEGLIAEHSGGGPAEEES